MCTRRVEVQTAGLRQNWEENPKYPRYLRTVRGLGHEPTDGKR
jgi:DNA-binding response OmpR family regulator